MAAEPKTRNGRRTGEPTGAADDAARAGAPSPLGPGASLILPCPLIVLGTTTAAETGGPLRDLLRRIGYL